MSANNGNNGNGHGVPTPRAGWIAQRKAENRDGNFSQMHYARRGVVTEEMEYVARRERLARMSREESRLASCGTARRDTCRKGPAHHGTSRISRTLRMKASPVKGFTRKFAA